MGLLSVFPTKVQMKGTKRLRENQESLNCYSKWWKGKSTHRNRRTVHAPQVTPQDTPQVTPQDLNQRLTELIEFCGMPRSKKR